jgi:hypothetical protein
MGVPAASHLARLHSFNRELIHMTTAKDVLKMIKDNDVKYADFRFTDPRGKWQHVTFDIGMIEKARCSTAPRLPAGRRSTSPTCA